MSYKKQFYPLITYIWQTKGDLILSLMR